MSPSNTVNKERRYTISALPQHFFFQMNLGKDASSIHKEIGDELSTLIAGWSNMVIYAVIGVLAWIINLQFSRTIQ